MSALFSSFTLKDVTLRNRIVAAPMCQYSATNGLVNDWHQAHLRGLARGGAGLVIIESTAVSPEGRITPSDTGLWNDAQAAAFAPIVAAIKAAGAVPGIQINHAGRRGSTNKPWEGNDHIFDDRGWPIIAPSALAYDTKLLTKIPRAMTLADIKRVQADFVSAAKRAHEAGFEWLELHFAHGFLGQSFFSPYSNKRNDEYGGSVVNRSRFLRETLNAVRAVWPDNLPLTMRFGVIEYDGRDEETVAQSIALVKQFKDDGLDLLSVSIGFSTTASNIPWGPALLAPVAERLRREVDIPVASGWGMGAPELAEQVVREGQVDLVKVGHALLANPHWPYYAAMALKVDRPSWTLPAPYAYWLERYHEPVAVGPEYNFT